jgi:hypothetical protein
MARRGVPDQSGGGMCGVCKTHDVGVDLAAGDVRKAPIAFGVGDQAPNSSSSTRAATDRSEQPACCAAGRQRRRLSDCAVTFP